MNRSPLPVTLPASLMLLIGASLSFSTSTEAHPIMTARQSIAPILAATLLGLSTLGMGAWADSDIEVDHDLAHEVQERIQRLPRIGDNEGAVTVEAVDGVLRLSGFVGSLEQRRAVTDVLEGVEGLHMDQIDDHIVQNQAKGDCVPAVHLARKCHGATPASGSGGAIRPASPPRSAPV